MTPTSQQPQIVPFALLMGWLLQDLVKSDPSARSTLRGTREKAKEEHIMKAKLYWSYPARSLVRGGQRTLLAIFCIAVGVLAVVALQLVGNMVNAGLTRYYFLVRNEPVHPRRDVERVEREMVE